MADQNKQEQSEKDTKVLMQTDDDNNEQQEDRESQQQQQEQQQQEQVQQQQVTEQQPRFSTGERVVLQLGEDHIGSTETDNIEQKTKSVSLEAIEDNIPSTSRAGLDTTDERQRCDESKEVPTIVKQPCANDDEYHYLHMIQLLNRFTQNLEAIEDHILSTDNCEAEMSSRRHLEIRYERSQQQMPGQGAQSEVPCSASVEQTLTSQRKISVTHLATQTMLSSLEVDVATNSSRRANFASRALDARPPCERIHHTITINAHAAPQRVEPPQRLSLWRRFVTSFGDFAAAFCMCLQVNKDCIFCLGFFVAFVVSASFLTAFFYRTLNMTHTVRLAQGPAINSLDDTPVRIKGGYYYLYNNPRQNRLS